MTVDIRCGACARSSRIPSELFASRFAGRTTSIRCKHCSARMVIDGDEVLARAARARRSLPPRPHPERPCSVRPAASAANSAAPKRDRSECSTRPAPAFDSVRPTGALLDVPAAPALGSLALEFSDAGLTSSGSLRAVEIACLDANADPGLAERCSDTLSVDSDDIDEATSPEKLEIPSYQFDLRSLRGPVGFVAAALSVTAFVLWGAFAESSVHHPTSALSAPEPLGELGVAARSAAFVSLAASASPRVEAAAKVPAAAVSASTALPLHAQKALESALKWASVQAEDCHRGGRATGTVRVDVTFAPSGKVRHAELSGEPIASAAVGRCVLAQFRQLLIPAFSGEDFAVSREITLR